MRVSCGGSPGIWKMPDFLRLTDTEFEQRFATEEACKDYLAACRWPDGMRLPRCLADDPLALTDPAASGGYREV